ncbi:hypothetical protein [Streptomyces sp. NPDC015125]|uniref:hypothetical protein n=1 Tax=Streptomyces sp. NPDC015125 TaxID=3364938 RepID=UPI0036F922E0
MAGHELADKPAAHANLARPFLHWFLLRRARQRAATRRHPASADRDLRRRVRVAWTSWPGRINADWPSPTSRRSDIDDWIAAAVRPVH